MSATTLLVQAQRMIREQDMAGWTDGHDAVVIDAIESAMGSGTRTTVIREAMAAIADTESRKHALEIMEGMLKP